MLRFVFIFFIGISISFVQAQQRKIIGQIVDSGNKKPLRNANIVILGTTSGTVSNALGFFELQIDPGVGKMLVISYVGYQTSQIELPEKDKFKILLNRERTELQEINLALYPRTIELQSETAPTGSNGFAEVETNAIYPGSIMHFYEDFGNALCNTPIKEMKDLRVWFTIAEDGKATHITSSDSSLMTKAALDTVFHGMKLWSPGTQRGVAVKQDFSIYLVNQKLSDVPNVSMLTGVKNLHKYVSEKVPYPAPARRMGVEGIVEIQFSLNTNGELTYWNVHRGIGADCEKEIAIVFAKMPRELLKEIREQASFSSFIIPITFGLDKPLKGIKLSNIEGFVQLPVVEIVAIGVERSRKVLGTPKFKN